VSISPARQAAFNILLRVERDGAYAGELLNAPAMDRLSAADRGLAYELVMSTLRWQSLLDTRIAAHCKQKIAKLDAEVRAALRLGACQLLRLERIPVHAAVHESVELVKFSGKRSATGLTNAVLRKLTADEKPSSAGDGEQNAATLSAEFAHPEWLVARWIDRYGYSAAGSICAANQHAGQAALRCASSQVEAELAAADVLLAPGLMLACARRVLAGDVVHTAAFREHRASIQDEASQLVAALVGRGEQILDCCAAPGGKTAAIAERNPQAQITAVDLHEHRTRLLQERLRAPNVTVLTGDASSMEWPRQFDRVLVDVPCSGTGTLAAHPEIKWRLRPENLAALQDLQISILRHAARALAPGGRLVYSTCSLEAEEGEGVVQQLLQGPDALRVVDCREVLGELRDSSELAWETPEDLLRGPYLRTLPGVHPCDGFFAAILTKA